MRKSIVLAACVSVLAACEKNEVVVNGSEMNEASLASDLAVKIEAEVGGKGMRSRTATDEGGSVSFVDNDNIGMFMPNTGKLVKWTYSKGVWATEPGVQWENKVDKFDFHAFYPYAEGAEMTSVAMPDLSVQSGKLEDVGSKDFIVARKTASFGTDSGKVSFTGENAFGHVYSLVYVTVRKEQESDVVSVSGVSFDGDGIASKCTYSFGATGLEDAVNLQPEGEVNSIGIEYPEGADVDFGTGHAVAVLVNPSTLSGNVTFSMTYTRDGKEYTATASLGSEFSDGKINKVSLTLKRDALVVEGSEVAEWDVNNLPDISVSENPV